MRRPEDLDDIRQKVGAIVQRAETDDDYRQRLKADPIAAFTAAGIPERVFPDLLREASDAPDVSGYMKCADTDNDPCHDFTCWTSGCPGSCYATW